MRSGLKSVGADDGSNAVPAGGFWAGVKNGTPGAGVLSRLIIVIVMNADLLTVYVIL